MEVDDVLWFSAAPLAIITCFAKAFEKAAECSHTLIEYRRMDESFSVRLGLRTARTSLQTQSIDGPLRNALWNAVCLYWFNSLDQTYLEENLARKALGLAYAVWTGFLHRTVDTVPLRTSDFKREVKNCFMGYEWLDVYEFIEFTSSRLETTNFTDFVNAQLSVHKSAYRFIQGKLAPITAELEISAIDVAIASSSRPVATHLALALEHLSDRSSPDYRNSIKESISAVEAMAQQITGDDKATLGSAIKKLPTPFPTSLQKALTTLYGYTSDADGIRHALSEANSDADEPLARFMLIVCSAFINLMRLKTSFEVS